MTVSGEVSVDVAIDDDRTVVRVTGTRDAALIARSASGEEIYLPPEDFRDDPDGGGADTPYESRAAPADTPYEEARPSDSSSRSDATGREPDPTTVGVESTPDGFRVVHPEPVRDLRLVR